MAKTIKLFVKDRTTYDFLSVALEDRLPQLSKDYVVTIVLDENALFFDGFGGRSLESLFKDWLDDDKNLKLLSNCLNETEDSLISMAAMIDNLDPYRWFEKVQKYLRVNGAFLMQFFYYHIRNTEHTVDDHDRQDKIRKIKDIINKELDRLEKAVKNALVI